MSKQTCTSIADKSDEESLNSDNQPNFRLLNFGTHSGKSIPQVLFTNPDWLFWAMEQDVFKKHPSLRLQAMDLAEKAKRIKVPQAGTETLVVEHFIHRPTKKYSHFELVPQSKPFHQGSSPAHRQEVIDLSFPRRIAPKDKTGNRNIVRSLKQTYFGSKSARMTRDRCEAFFSEPDNFDIRGSLSERVGHEQRSAHLGLH